MSLRCESNPDRWTDNNTALIYKYTFIWPRIPAQCLYCPPTLTHSVDVPRSVGSQLLPDHWEAGGGGAGVPDGGGAHLQPLLRAAGEVCWLLRGREPRVPSHPDHKRHHAGTARELCKIWLSLLNVCACVWSIAVCAVIPLMILTRLNPSAVENQAIRAGSRICWDDVCGASDMWM